MVFAGVSGDRITLVELVDRAKVNTSGKWCGFRTEFAIHVFEPVFLIHRQIRPVFIATKTAPSPAPFVVCSRLKKLRASRHVKGISHLSRVGKMPSVTALHPMIHPRSADRPWATLPTSSDPIALEHQREQFYQNKHRKMPG